MAGDELIRSYARELSARLGGRASSISEEVLDHLVESVDARVAGGTDRARAEQEAIAAFGTPAEVAASYTAYGVGLPTRFTRAAGIAAMAAAVLVVGGLATVVASVVAELSNPWDGLPRTLGNVGGIVVMAGAILGAVGATGLLRRQGRVLGWSSVAVGLLGIAAAGALMAWFVWGWVSALAIGGSILAFRLRRAALAPSRAALRVGIGAAAAGCIPWLSLAANSAGWVASEKLMLGGVALGLLVWASGIGPLGWWLFREAPDRAP
jgi:hypothetical protein